MYGIWTSGISEHSEQIIGGDDGGGGGDHDNKTCTQFCCDYSITEFEKCSTEL